MLLPSFYIENFRLFDKLEVKRFSRVNLFVGRNNVGKSAFLEAIYIYASGADPEVFDELIQSRQEYWKSVNQIETEKFSLNPMRHFFKGHKIPLLNESGFKLADNKMATPIHVKTAGYVREETDKGFTRRKLGDSEETENITSEIEIFVIAEQGGNTLLMFPEGMNLREFRRRLFLRDRSPSPIIPQLVPVQGISNRKAAQLWDAINLTDLTDVVINGLKLVEKRLLALAFIEGELRENRLPLVKLEGEVERISLKSLGDGINRVFHIMLALVNAKGGVLLIDEFENGLHWTVQESVWRVLFTMAVQLDVQVFCTTHSRDCIKAFETVWHEFENEGAFLRLYAHNHEIRVREYDLETLSDSLETDVEVR
jgi:AAA15 family ATPase/GTPase